MLKAVLVSMTEDLQRKSGFLKSLTYAKRTRTAVEALQIISIPYHLGVSRFEDLHASHKHNRNKRNLVRPLQIQLHNQNNRQKRKRKVTNQTAGAVQVRQRDNHIDIDAAALLVLVPEEGLRVALEQSDEEEDHARDNCAGQDEPDCDDVGFADGDAEEEPADADFGGDHGGAVPHVAEPPVLALLAGRYDDSLDLDAHHHCFLKVFWVEIFPVSARAVVHADEGTRNEQREEDLGFWSVYTITSYLIISEILRGTKDERCLGDHWIDSP